MILRNIRHGALDIPELEIRPGETLCILGRNDSGKSLLADLVSGRASPAAGAVEDPPRRAAILSFETLQADYERELANDDTDFLDRIDYGSTGLELLLESGAGEARAIAAARQHGLESLLPRGCRQFSTGELRKIHLLRAILAEPDLLALDEPYEGLDRESRSALDALADSALRGGAQILLLVSRLGDIAPWTDTIALLRAGRIVRQARREDFLQAPDLDALVGSAGALPQLPHPPPGALPPDPLVAMRACRVAYDGIAQFEALDWTLRPGEHTLVTGPNGCGKSTLLNLISGDHPQCYSNDLRILGYQRGSGESIWDIKSRIGLVSPALHRDYRVNAAAQDVVASGFFDSIGLYQQPRRAEVIAAREWLEVLGIERHAAQAFRSLSYGLQRLVLIARALVKQPPLLILDEPTQGLDDANQKLALACLERLAGLRQTTLLFVSHREDERLPLFRAHLRFEPDPAGRARYRIEATAL